MNISGGTTVVYGSAGGENAALDFDGKCSHTGGTLLAIGNSSMAQSPSSGLYVMFGGRGGFPGGGFPGGERPGNPGDNPPDNPGGERPGNPGDNPPDNPGFPGGSDQQSGFSIKKDDTITIKDSEGNVICTAKGEKDANSVLYVSDGLVKDAAYTLYINDEAAAEATASEGTGSGGFDPGGFTRGDISGDGNVDNVDLVTLARYLVQLETFDERQLRAADYVFDNKIDNVDLVALAMYIVSK